MRLWPHGRWRRTILIAAVAAAIVAVSLSLALVRSPVRARAAATGPAQHPQTTLSAGLADVRTVRGVVVFDGPQRGSDPPVERVIFAYDANGDGYFDIRYRPDLAAKRQAWRSYNKSDRHSDTDPQFVQTAGALTRRVVVMSAKTGLQKTMAWSVDPFTGKVISQRYRFYAGFFSDAPLVSRDARSVTLVWRLTTVLDSELPALDEHASVSPTSVAGGPGWRVVVRTGGRATYGALVDRYGLTEQVRSLQGWHDLRPFTLVPFHVEGLVVNGALPAGTFTMRPSYRYGPDGYSPRKPTDTPSKYGIDLGGERGIPLADVPRLTSSWTLVPGWLPSGYRLTQVLGWSDQHLWFVYRRGLLMIEVGTAGRRPTWVSDGELRHGFVFGHRTEWGWEGWPEIGPGAVSRLEHGAMSGWPAGDIMTEQPGHNAVGTVAFGVSGTAPFATLRRIAESVHQARPGAHLPTPRPTWPAWIALVAACLSLAAALRARQRRFGDLATSLRRRPPLLAGLAMTAVGATLSWHALYKAGDRFAVMGWREPLAVLCVAAALLAGTAALWPARTHRQAIAARLFATGLGLASLATALVALVYLPLQARFLIDDDPNLVLKWTSGHAIAAYFGGAVCPGPGPGLYLSIAGAIVVVIAALRLWPPQPAPVVEG